MIELTPVLTNQISYQSAMFLNPSTQFLVLFLFASILTSDSLLWGMQV
jgi:hypothetical protein